MSTATGQATEIQMQNAGVEMHKLGNFSIVDCREVWIDAENDYTLATIAHSCPVEEMGSKDIRLRSNTTLGCGCCGTAADLILVGPDEVRIQNIHYEPSLISRVSSKEQ